jgi:hypothetical protein
VQSVDFSCCNGCNCMGGGLCFVFKWSEVTIQLCCRIGLQLPNYNWMVSTWQCGQSTHRRGACIVHDAHGGVHSTLLTTCMNIVNRSRPVHSREPETCIWQSSRYLDHKSSSMIYIISIGYSMVDQYCTCPKNCMR